MSQSLEQTAFNVRRMIGDNDSQPVLDSPFTVLPAIIRQADALANAAGVGTVWAASYFSSTAGSAADIQLPPSSPIPFQSILDIRDTVYGRILNRVSLAEINRAREGIRSTTTARGIPLAYALWEDDAQIATLRFECVPQATQDYDLCYRAVPLLTTDPATSLDFSPTMLHGIEYASAAELASRMPPEAIARFGITPGTVKGWQAMASYCVNEEWKRQARMKRAAYAVGAVIGWGI